MSAPAMPPLPDNPNPTYPVVFTRTYILYGCNVIEYIALWDHICLLVYYLGKFKCNHSVTNLQYISV